MKKESKIKIYVFNILLLAALTVFDQLTKYLVRTRLHNPIDIIKNVLQLVYVKNDGAAWGMMAGKQLFFIILTSALMLFIVFVLVRTPADRKYRPFRIILTILLSGALGNYIDRVVKGYVDDFIYFKLIDFPVFNVADICVTCSMVALFILIIFKYKDGDLNFVFHRKESSNNE